MTLAEQLQIAILFVACVSGVGVPVAIFRMGQQDKNRGEMRNEMHEKFTHLDICVDDLKKRVMGEMCSRNELVSMKAELTETLNRMRAAISGDTKGLHDRIMRLENLRFGAADD